MKYHFRNGQVATAALKGVPSGQWQEYHCENRVPLLQWECHRGNGRNATVKMGGVPLQQWKECHWGNGKSATAEME